MENPINVEINGKTFSFEKGITFNEVLKDINKLTENIIAVKVNDKFLDLNERLDHNCSLEPVDVDSSEGEEILRHSASHVMAQAVLHLFLDAKFAIGPAIEKGFYYDFDIEHTFTLEDLDTIENEMRRIVSQNLPFERKVLNKDEAIKFFNDRGQEYKAEIIAEVEDNVVSLYNQGDFVDLCRGPHVPSTGYVKYFKLLSVAGAYWRGDENNKMLQRIYGTAFASEEKLKDYLNFLEEAKKRDHRKIGKELDLFSINEDLGPGLILWHPKGAIIRKVIEDFWREEHIKRGYQFVYSPHIARLELWETSGHWDFYRENMYSPMEVDKGSYEIKPMNCPFHIMIYKSKTRSYKDLPMRFAELGTVYRYERAGVLHGLLRVRGFTQDDAHLFVTPEKLESEIMGVLEFTKYMVETFGFTNYNVYLSTRPEHFVGDPENWEIATDKLKSSLEKLNFKYTVDPGAGAFYGPKVDVKLVDAIGREWQGPTVQVDFALPERFDINYIGEDGREHRPVMLHRVVIGAMERFFGNLIEQYAGAFPTWLSPVQVKILPIADRHVEYANKIYNKLFENWVRVEIDSRNEKVNAKIRDAEMEKTPYVLVVGDKEIDSNSVSVRKRKQGNLGSMQVDEFVERIKQEIHDKVID